MDVVMENSFIRGTNAQWRARLHSTTADNRMHRINELQGLLLIVEIMLSGELQRFAKRSLDFCIDGGLYKQNEKSLINQLSKLANGLQSRSLQIDSEVIMNHIYELMPYYADKYIREGGGTVVRFQQAIAKESGDVIEQLYLSIKNMVDKHKVEHSEYCSSLLTMLALSQTGVEVYDTIKKQQNALMTAYGAFAHRRKGDHHERIIKLVEDLLLLHMIDVSTWKDTRENTSCRGHLKKLHTIISGENLQKISTRTFTVVSMEYAEYSLACACIDLKRNGSIPNEVYDKLVDMVGCQYAEDIEIGLKNVSYNEDMDVWDVMDVLPLSGDKDAFQLFRSICLERPDLPRSYGERVKLES